MPYREFHYHWVWRLEASPQALWPFVADTNRFNRDTGLPPVVQRLEDGLPTSNARRRLHFSRFGIRVEWEEEPFEWVRPYRFGVVRRYYGGPVLEMRAVAELTPQAAGGTQLVYDVWVQPRNWLGVIAVPIQIGLISARSFAAAFRRYDRLIMEGKSFVDTSLAPVHFAPGGRARLAALRERLLAQGASPVLLGRLIETLENADDMTVARLRPYALADYWEAPRRDVLELCLLATRAGLLDFQWDLLCPLCRVPKASSASMGDVQPQVHCETCNIDFSASFERSVELTFRPNSAVRPVENWEFCLAGPRVTPHIAAQQLLPPGERRSVTPSLELGRYRLRTMRLPGGQFLAVTPGGQRQATLCAGDDGWPVGELTISPEPNLHLENATGQEQLFILERTAWSDQAATAAEVIVLQRFRDLFSSEALRPGERISVGSLAVVFTDLRGSTRLYRQVGDAPAFGVVMNHFDVLREAIVAEEGSIVKTIGDSVMAAFRRPVAALRAVLKAQQTLASPGEGMQPLWLKAGVHFGPAIAVTLNDRLDYFGSTVNMAARLESLSSGRDVVISGAVRDDPEVAEWLAQAQTSLAAAPFEAMLKGFDQEGFELWRVSSVMRKE